jgi:hypothetical protein
MKSIKPGRGPSMMGGAMSIGMAIFGVLWTVVVFGSGGGIFAAFGLVFIGIAIVQAVYHFKNASGKNRYSSFDIVDGQEEPDPLNQRYGAAFEDAAAGPSAQARPGAFCPYCGARVEGDFAFCNQCGKKLPD